jgi:UDP-2,3-diacylglucosamine hydrolase
MKSILQPSKKIYFASDFHLGAPNEIDSKQRELRIIEWLEEIQHDAQEIFLVGDIFDFWFEYQHVAPKGYIRLLGKIAQLTDKGIPVHIHVGNHDMWMFGYLKKELGVSIHYQAEERDWNGIKFLIGHGDGLGPGDYGYKFLKKIFRNRFFQWCFARIHPNLGFSIATRMSLASRKANHKKDTQYLGDENEWLVMYCKEVLQTNHYQYMIFGHRHLPIQKEISSGCFYFNLGDWITYSTYAVFNGEKLELKTFSSTN